MSSFHGESHNNDKEDDYEDDFEHNEEKVAYLYLCVILLSYHKYHKNIDINFDQFPNKNLRLYCMTNCSIT